MRLFIILFFVSFPVFANDIRVEFDNAPVREVARFYSEVTGVPVVVDQSVSGTVSVFSAQVPESEFITFFESVLTANGYTLLNGSPRRLLSSSNSSSSLPSIDDFQRNNLYVPRPDFLSQVDVPSEPVASRFFSFSNVRAVDLVDVVRSVVSVAASDTATNQAASVTVVPASNSLVVTAPVSRLDFLTSVISDFDVSRPQVYISAVFYELSDTQSLDLGISARSVGSSSVDAGFNVSGLASGVGSGVSFGVFDGDMLAFAVNAVRRDGSARLLSTPNVMTLSGSTGRINVGQVVPVVTGRATGEAASLDSPFQTIERVSVGLGLTVSPVVLGSGAIVMDITASADSVSDASFASDIVTNERQISSTVRLIPGQTLSIGGLISDDQSDSVTGVPLLSDIPLLGRLFRSDSSSSENRTLNVLLTAKIIN